jgi:KR domain/Phosphopantetheine attachment site
LRGIIHAAMDLEDRLVADWDEAHVARVLGPRVGGAWNLHTLTQGIGLDFFVCFSSLAGWLGVPGQASYAASNTFLDSLAHYRRSLGLPALTIDWGYLGGLGYVARDPRIGQRLERLGLNSFSPLEAVTLLERLLQGDQVQIGVVRIDQELWRKTWALGKLPPRLRELVWADQEAEGAGIDGQALFDRESLLTLVPEQRRDLLLGVFRENLSQVLGLDKEQIDVHTPIQYFGMDSLTTLQLKGRVEAQTGVRLITIIHDGMSVAQIIDQLLAHLDDTDAPIASLSTSPKSAPTTSFNLVKRLDELPDAELVNILEDLDLLLQRKIQNPSKSTD